MAHPVIVWPRWRPPLPQWFRYSNASDEGPVVATAKSASDTAVVTVIESASVQIITTLAVSDTINVRISVETAAVVTDVTPDLADSNAHWVLGWWGRYFWRRPRPRSHAGAAPFIEFTIDTD